MTLRELLLSVDAKAYASVPLFEELLNTKSEYGFGNRIEVKLINGEIAVSRSTLVALLAKNVHVVHWVTSWQVPSMWLQTFR